ncbi:acetate non-utilizing protein 9 [Cichlidogyrus casuarinus]|uniref:Succinate dehydrogenase assembly factor 3 n=1 Tax=Cichlidogyrus casuarinus TaxID=1844966 RepID=A0ABD2QES3_9PLAT
MSNLTHPQRVRFLYKTILRLHKGLPPEMKELGDRYVKDEFKRHKTASVEYVKPFMVEWSSYASQLAQQIKISSNPKERLDFGAKIAESSISHFTEEQLNQLLLLAEEIFNYNTDTNKT